MDSVGIRELKRDIRRFPKSELAVDSEALADLSAQIAADLWLRGADAV